MVSNASCLTLPVHDHRIHRTVSQPRIFLLLVAVLTAPASHAAGEPTRLVQSSRAERGLVLVQESRKAWVETLQGGRTRLPLLQGEKVADFAETDHGWIVAGTRTAEEDQNLFVIRQDGSRRVRLPDPGGEPSPFRLAPVILQRHQDLDGLAWLAGDNLRSLAVHFAGSGSDGWEEAQIISPPGPGSQTGLTGATLSDGSRLLVWSAFDGEDDELLWSRWDGRSWTAPRRLAANNSTPDITPHIIATQGGAMLTWSRFESGQYRLKLARYSAGVWRMLPAPGPIGSISPRFLEYNGTLHLIYRLPWPAAWTVADLDDRGGVRRQAVLRESASERPALTSSGARAVSLRFAGRNNEHFVDWTGSK